MQANKPSESTPVDQKVDFLCDLAEKLNQQIKTMSGEIVSLRSALPINDTLTVTDLGRKLGVSPQSFYGKPWNLPNFGSPDIGHNPRHWLISTVNAWYSRPESERRAAWEAMTDDEKIKAMA